MYPGRERRALCGICPAVYTGRGSFELAMGDIFQPRGVAFSSGGFGDLVELGSGSSRKIKILLDVKEKEQVEMHLRATRETSARIADLGLTLLCRNGGPFTPRSAKNLVGPKPTGIFRGRASRPSSGLRTPRVGIPWLC